MWLWRRHNYWACCCCFSDWFSRTIGPAERAAAFLPSFPPFLCVAFFGYKIFSVRLFVCLGFGLLAKRYALLLLLLLLLWVWMFEWWSCHRRRRVGGLSLVNSVAWCSVKGGFKHSKVAHCY
jgi:hypothetical protein